jgi:hypothetical protein
VGTRIGLKPSMKVGCRLEGPMPPRVQKDKKRVFPIEHQSVLHKVITCHILPPSPGCPSYGPQLTLLRLI